MKTLITLFVISLFNVAQAKTLVSPNGDRSYEPQENKVLVEFQLIINKTGKSLFCQYIPETQGVYACYFVNTPE